MPTTVSRLLLLIVGAAATVVAAPVERLEVPGCAWSRPVAQWPAFAGGFYVDRPACVPVVVETTTARTRVNVAVGVPCGAVAI